MKVYVIQYISISDFCIFIFLLGIPLKTSMQLEYNLCILPKISVQDLTDDLSGKDSVVSKLVEMGFLAEEASSAIDRCGMLLETLAVRT